MTETELVKIIKEELNIVLEGIGDAAYWTRVLGPEMTKAIEGAGMNMNQWAEFMKASKSELNYSPAPRIYSKDPELKGMWEEFNKAQKEIRFLERAKSDGLSPNAKRNNAQVQKLIKPQAKKIRNLLTKNKRVSQIMKGLRGRLSGGVSIAPKSKAGQLTIADISDDKALAVINKQATDSKFKKLLKKIPIVGRFLVVAGLIAGAEDAYAKGGASGLSSFVGKSGLEMTPILGDIISAVELARIAGAPASAMDPAPGLKPGLKL